MSCVNCHYYDANYHNGYCDRQQTDCEPYDDCADYWEDSSKYIKYTCEQCYYFDSEYHDGFCDRNETDVYPSSSCDDFTR